MSGPTPPPASPTRPPAPTPTPTTTVATTVPLPLGFSAQLQALQTSHQTLNARLTALERENALLKASIQQQQHQQHQHQQHQHQQPPTPPPDPTLLSRITALEAQNRYLHARRREAVAQLLNLRTLHQESANAFLLRAQDLQEDDLEGVLCVWGTSVTTVVNSQQRVLGMLRGSGGGWGFAYPVGYAQSGYCFAHGAPYPCSRCG